jgi:hypothetical protein
MLLLTALLLLQAPSPAPKPEVVPPARIELTTPFPAHLGSAGPREVREAVFGIKSLHDRPFRFRVLDLSLGVSLDPAQLAEPLQPGEVRMVRLKVATEGLEGLVKGAVRLGTDDPAQPNYILRYDVDVRPEVSVDGLRKSFGDVAHHERPEARYRFTREGGEPLKLVLAREVPAYLDAELIHEGATAELRLRLRPEHLKPGMAAGLEVLKVATNGPRQPLFTLYLDWRLATAVVPSPSRLVFGDRKTTRLELELTGRGGKPFRILRATIQGKGFRLLDAPGPEALRHRLRIQRTGTTSEAMLILQCSSMDQPLRVPLRFLDPEARPATVTPPPDPIDEHRHH